MYDPGVWSIVIDVYTIFSEDSIMYIVKKIIRSDPIQRLSGKETFYSATCFGWYTAIDLILLTVEQHCFSGGCDRYMRACHFLHTLHVIKIITCFNCTSGPIGWCIRKENANYMWRGHVEYFWWCDKPTQCRESNAQHDPSHRLHKSWHSFICRVLLWWKCRFAHPFGGQVD